MVMSSLRLSSLALVASVFLANSGCGAAIVPVHQAGVHSAGASAASVVLYAAIMAATAPNAAELQRQHEQDDAAAAQADDRDDELRDTKELLGSPAPAPTQADELDGTLAVGALRASMSDVDLAQCRDAGVPRGYGHARITIEPEGVMSKILIDSPSGMPPSAIHCVGARLSEVPVPEFRGEATTFGMTWFVP